MIKNPRAVVILICALAAGSLAAAVPDPVMATPNAYKVVLDDGLVRVLQHALDVGGHEALHHHPCRVSYSLGDHFVRHTLSNGQRIERRRAFRSAWWRSAEDIEIDNLGSKVIKELIVELKVPLNGTSGCGGATEALSPSPTNPAPADHATRAAMNYYKVAYENAALRVIENSVPAGVTTPRHQLGCRVIYALADQTVRLTRADGRSEDLKYALTTARWRPAEELVVENRGTTNLFNLVIEFKDPTPSSPACAAAAAATAAH